MDLTWSAIFKVLSVGLATYILMPAFLILRDYLLWRLVNAYILNNELRRAVFRYAALAHRWNSKHVVESKIDSSSGEVIYTIGGEEVSKDAWYKFQKESDSLQRQISELKLLIDRKSRLLTWLLRHYKQEQTNPIDDWKVQAKERVGRSD